MESVTSILAVPSTIAKSVAQTRRVHLRLVRRVPWDSAEATCCLPGWISVPTKPEPRVESARFNLTLLTIAKAMETNAEASLRLGNMLN